MSDTNVQAPTRSQFKPLKEVRTIREALGHPDMIARFKEAVPKHVSPERMLRVCALAVAKTPKLAECDMMSLLGAMLALAALGMEPNTPLGHAYLIPFEKRRKEGNKWVTDKVEVQVIIGYRGYIDLARRSGSLVSLHADVVYEGDIFSFEYGSNMHLKHVPQGARGERKPLWAYFHARLSDGEAFEVLPYAQVLKIRDGSQGYISAVRSKERYPDSFAKNPWVAFEHEMISKTLVRRMGKWIPMSIELANAAALDAMSETGNTDLRSLATAGAHDLADAMALTYDEYVPAFDIGGGDEREEVPVETHQEQRQEPTQQRREPERQEPKHQPKRETTQREPAPTKQADPIQEPQQTDPLYLVDADGNMAGGPYATPMAYAHALEDLIKEAFPGDRQAILEQNDEFMGPAEYASTEAREIFQRLRGDSSVDAEDAPAEEGLKAKETPQEQPSGWVVAIPQRTGGKPDLPGYLAAARASLAQHVTTDAGLTAWRAANKPTYDAMPKATRFGVDAAVADHRKTLGLDKAPIAEVAAREETHPNEESVAGDRAPAPAEDKPKVWAELALADIEAMADGGSALRWIDANQADMAWLKKERPELHADVRAAIARKQGGI